MPTQLSVANLALAHLMIGKPIGAMNEATQSARVMTQFYAQARDEVFRDFNWPFARRFAQLVLVSGPTPPATPDFPYSYRSPVALAIRDVIVGSRRPGAPFIGGSVFSAFGAYDQPMPAASRITFEVGGDDTGQLIYTDAAPDLTNGLPIVEYTKAVDEAQWASDFTAAVSFKLAWYAAPALTAGDPHKLGDRAMGGYLDALGRAKANSRNEQQDDQDPEAGSISARY